MTCSVTSIYFRRGFSDGDIVEDPKYGKYYEVFYDNVKTGTMRTRVHKGHIPEDVQVLNLAEIPKKYLKKKRKGNGDKVKENYALLKLYREEYGKEVEEKLLEKVRSNLMAERE